jgi:hypothetical protein
MSLDPVDALLLACLPFRQPRTHRQHKPSDRQAELEAAIGAVFAERARTKGRKVEPTPTIIDREGAMLAFTRALDRCRDAGIPNVDLVEAFNGWAERTVRQPAEAA